MGFFRGRFAAPATAAHPKRGSRLRAGEGFRAPGDTPTLRNSDSANKRLVSDNPASGKLQLTVACEGWPRARLGPEAGHAGLIDEGSNERENKRGLTARDNRHQNSGIVDHGSNERDHVRKGAVQIARQFARKRVDSEPFECVANLLAGTLRLSGRKTKQGHRNIFGDGERRKQAGRSEEVSEDMISHGMENVIVEGGDWLSKNFNDSAIGRFQEAEQMEQECFPTARFSHDPMEQRLTERN